MQSMGLVSLGVIVVLTIMWSALVGHSVQLKTMTSERIIYSPSTLRGIGHSIEARPRLPDQLFSTLQNLNIARIRPRGNRAGKAKRHLDEDKPIATDVNNNNTAGNNRSRETGSFDRGGNPVNIKPGVKACVLNCQSANNKPSEIYDHIISSDIDIIALTETWLTGTESDQRIIGKLTPPGYSFHQVPRYGRTGGGVAVLCRDSFKIRVLPTYKASSFETMEIAITAVSVTIKLIVVYRIPPNRNNGIRKREFVQEFTDLLEKINTDAGKLLILGDFNVHWDNKNASETKAFQSLLDSYNLVQHIEESTHKKGHVLDWVISRPVDNLVKSCQVDSMISDHHAVHIDLACSRPHPERKTVTFRNTKDIDVNKFKCDILKSDLYTKPADDIDGKVNQYNDILKCLMDTYAPEKTKKVAIKDNRPWMTEKIANAKRRRRKFERRWRQSKLTVHRQAYEAERENVKKLIEDEQVKYYNNKVEECSGDQKKLFSIVDKLLNKGKSTALPEHDNLKTLVNEFSDFFQGKIETIRSSLTDLQETAEPLTCPPVSDLFPPSKIQIDSFKLATQDEILKIIKSSSKASCSLDPVPTRLLTEHFLPELLPVITDIVNMSLSSGKFPDSLKLALVKPLLKKLSLNPEIHKNFRPVSNLSFLSKIIEKIMANRLFQHMSDNDLHDKMQSAYKAYHSTETALL